MNFIKKLFKILLFGFLGLIVLSLALGYFLTPSDEEMTKYRAQEQAQKQRQKEESKARIKASLKAQIENNRAGIVQEINDLIRNKDYMLARRKADRFREFDDPELKKLAETAALRQAEVERIKKQQEEKRIAAAMQRMTKKTDKIEGVDWYRDKSSPTYNNQNGFFLYVGKHGASNPWLRLRIQYYADDWLFIESFIVVADGRRFERPHVKFERDHDSKIWEWYDENLTDADMQMIKDIIASKEAVIRFNGQQYRSDKTITAGQKASLQNIIDAYKALGGK